MVMIARLDGKDSSGFDPAKTLLAWLQKGIIPEGLSKDEEQIYNYVLEAYQKIKSYLEGTSDGDRVSFKRDVFMDDVRDGRFRQTVFRWEFDLLGFIEKIKAGKGHSDINLPLLRKQLLECDYRRANLEPYADTALSDINKGHWELFEAPEDSAIAIPLPPNQVWTARRRGQRDLCHRLRHQEFRRRLPWRRGNTASAHRDRRLYQGRRAEGL